MIHRPVNPEDASEHLLQWQDRLHDAVDGALDQRALADILAHAQECSVCGKEYAALTALNARLKQEFAAKPALNSDFSAALFARIDAQEETHRRLAKQRAEQEFRKRMQAFSLDWRELWQRHMGSIIALLTVFGAIAAAFGSMWATVRGQLLSTFAFVPGFHAMTLPVVAASIAISVGTLLFLRTKRG